MEEIVRKVIQEELARRSEALASVTSGQHYELKNRIAKVEETIMEIKTMVEPVLETIETAGNLRKGAIWLSGFIIAVTGSVFGLKTMWDWFK